MEGRANAIPHGSDSVRALAERLRDWSRRARTHVSAKDLLHFGPLGVWQTVSRFGGQRDRLTDLDDDLGARDEEFVELVLDAARVIGRYWFRFEVRGVDRVPASGPVLLVGNHNGGVMPVDTVLTVLALRDRFGPSRAVYLLGHDLLAFDPVGRRLASKFGILRASHESAAKAIRAGHIVIVYPGSDLDSWRPFRDRFRVQLAGRTGFIRLAVRERIPLVPVVSAGTHEQLYVLTSGQRIARRLGLKQRLRCEAFPVVLALPWGLTSGFFPYLPLPAQTTLCFGEPIHWDSTGARDADDPSVLARRYEEVERAMQSMLEALQRDRWPLVGPSPLRRIRRVVLGG